MLLTATDAAALFRKYVNHPSKTEEETPDTMAVMIEEEAGPYLEELNQLIEYAARDTILRVAIVLPDIYGKKEMEFSRGFLLGLHDSDLPQYSIALKMVNGEIPSDSLHYELDGFGPHVIFATHEKGDASALVNYATEHDSKLINVFDARGTDYRTHHNVYQLLAPSQGFNKSAANYFKGNFGHYGLMIIGEPDTNDAIISDMIEFWPEEQLFVISKDDLPLFDWTGNENYLIYPSPSASNEVKEILSTVMDVMLENPQIDFKVIGRPNWIAFNELNSIIANHAVFIPAKCYFDPASGAGKKFITAYHAKYGHSPIKSYPVFAVSGYDVATYFLPKLLNDLQYDTTDWQPQNTLQQYFDIRSDGVHEGYYNAGGFIIQFDPWGTARKQLIN